MLNSRLLASRCSIYLSRICFYSTPTEATVSATSATSTHIPPDSSSNPRAKKEKVVKSSCEAGVVMKGLSIMKDGKDPVAFLENEYPSFLWKLLASDGKGSQAGSEKKEARKENRAAIKRKNFFSGKL